MRLADGRSRPVVDGHDVVDPGDGPVGAVQRAAAVEEQVGGARHDLVLRRRLHLRVVKHVPVAIAWVPAEGYKQFIIFDAFHILHGNVEKIGKGFTNLTLGALD